MRLLLAVCGRDPGRAGRAGLCHAAHSHGPRYQICSYGSDLFTFLGWEASGQACNYKVGRAEGPSSFPHGGLMASGHLACGGGGGRVFTHQRNRGSQPSPQGLSRPARASSVHSKSLPQPPEASEATISESASGSKLMRKPPLLLPYPAQTTAPLGDLAALSATSPAGCVTNAYWPSEFHSLPASAGSRGPVGWGQQPLGSSVASASWGSHWWHTTPLPTARTPLSPPQAHGVTAPPLGLVPLSHRGPKESEGRVVASLDREQDTFVGERNGRPGPSACRPAGSPWDPAGQEGRRWPGLRSDFLFHGSSPPAR